MAAPIIDILAGIKTRLLTIPGLRVVAYVAPQVNPPVAIVGIPPVSNYHSTMGRGKYQLEPTVTVLVSAAADEAGQQRLLAYANPTGDQSVVTAIEADRSLAGVVDDCVVDSFRPLGLEEVGAIGYFGGIWSLRVVASGV